MVSGLRKKMDIDACVRRTHELVAAAVKACPALRSRLSRKALSGAGGQRDLRALFTTQSQSRGGVAENQSHELGHSQKRSREGPGNMPVTSPKKKKKISDFFT
jgi:hypothetical protein